MLSFAKSSASSDQDLAQPAGHGYSYSIFAEKAEPSNKLPGIKGGEWFSRKGGWKRLILFLGLFFITVIALVAGIVLGIKKHNSNR
jgi:hypothetical protein